MTFQNATSKIAVLVVEDDHELREAIVDTLSLANCITTEACSAEEACLVLEKQNFDIIFSDVCMGEMDGHGLLRWVQQHKPQIPLVLMTAYGTIERSVEAMRLGAADYLVKPFEPKVLLKLLERYAGADASFDGPVIGDAKTQAIYDVAKRVAQSDSTVMISGESGTGKEVLSQFIHRQSSRNGKPFVAINCAAIPETMLEATLFGHEKGAFTGAYNSAPGKFEQANGGTLLLDEVSEMELGLQAKLLRVLQERELERVGGRKMIPLDVRVIATTNRNLRSHVEAGKFREDLFYRLSVFPLHLPSLQERSDDIIPLAEYLLEQHASRMHRLGLKLDASAKEKLVAYQWPGNVRELDNLMQRAIILCIGQEITASDLLFDEVFGQQNLGGSVLSNTTASGTGVFESMPGSYASGSDKAGGGDGASELQADMQRHELEKIKSALEKTQGSKKEAAELLGLSPRTLRYKMAKFREIGLLED